MSVRIVRAGLRDLSAQETDALLAEDVSACLAFVDGEGFPRQVPCWFLWAEGAFHATSLADKYHVRWLQADARASFCVEVESREGKSRSNRQVKGIGRVEIFPDEAGRWGERIRRKYLGPSEVAVGSMSVERVVLRLVPERLVAHGGGLRVTDSKEH